MLNGLITIDVDAMGLVAMFSAMAGQFRPMLLTELAIGSEIIKEKMREEAPIGVGDEDGLKGSIGYSIDPLLLTSEIKPSMPYGDAVEEGSRPHWVSAKPGSPLEQWARLKGINVYAVQRSIAIKGTKAHPYIQPTYVETAPLFADSIAKGIHEFTEEMQHGL